MSYKTNQLRNSDCWTEVTNDKGHRVGLILETSHGLFKFMRPQDVAPFTRLYATKEEALNALLSLVELDSPKETQEEIKEERTEKEEKVAEYNADIQKLKEIKRLYESTTSLCGAFYSDMICEIDAQVLHLKMCIKNLGATDGEKAKSELSINDSLANFMAIKVCEIMHIKALPKADRDAIYTRKSIRKKKEFFKTTLDRLSDAIGVRIDEDYFVKICKEICEGEGEILSENWHIRWSEKITKVLKKLFAIYK